MFRFFRHIRQNLLQQGKVSRYLGYAIGEIVLIMIGIFLALQLNNWNEERMDRIEEREILARLLKEVQTHLAGFPQRFDSIEKKQKALKGVALAFNGQPIEDNKAFLSDVVTGTKFPWGSSYTRLTFEELQSSGKLGLVQNTSLREEIIGYYASMAKLETMFAERAGEYTEISYNLIPSETGATVRLDPELTEDQYASVAQLILNSDLHLHITREVNYAKILHWGWNRNQDRGIQLASEIEAELAK